MAASDETLRNHVLAELDFDPSVDAGEIRVAVQDGRVALTGQAASLAQKQAAHEATARVKGVRAIVQDIQVRPPLDPKTDEDLADRAAKVLAWASALPRDGVRVDVARGVATLTGEVGWDYQRRIAEQEVRRLDGVVDVRNRITLKFRHPPADTKGRIEEALARNGLDVQKMSVTAEAGAVTLDGVVGSWFDGDLAERAAWSVPGVNAVDNRLTILDDRASNDLVA